MSGAVLYLVSSHEFDVELLTLMDLEHENSVGTGGARGGAQGARALYPKLGGCSPSGYARPLTGGPCYVRTSVLCTVVRRPRPFLDEFLLILSDICSTFAILVLSSRQALALHRSITNTQFPVWQLANFARPRELEGIQGGSPTLQPTWNMHRI